MIWDTYVSLKLRLSAGEGIKLLFGQGPFDSGFYYKRGFNIKILTKYKNIHLEDSPTQRLELICVAAPSCRLTSNPLVQAVSPTLTSPGRR